jgi:hypothetical protein
MSLTPTALAEAEQQSFFGFVKYGICVLGECLCKTKEKYSQ